MSFWLLARQWSAIYSHVEKFYKFFINKCERYLDLNTHSRYDGSTESAITDSTNSKLFT